jgi:type II secretory pathway pseudopilin PulG
MNSDLTNATPVPGARDRRAGERGYTLLFAVFLVALALIATTIAVPSILTQGRREKELDMVWRGKQYEKAIGRYVRKFNRNPTKIDDLVKGTNGVRFLRQAYKDPMNEADGSWRLIYVTGGGALIGSVRYTSLQQMAIMDRIAMGLTGGVAGMPNMPGMPGLGVPGAGLIGGLAGGQGGGSSFGGSTFGGSTFGGQSGASGGSGPGSQGNGQSPQGNPTDPTNGNPQSPDQSGGNNPSPNSPGGQSGFGAFGGGGQSTGGAGIGTTLGQPIGSPLETTTIGGSIAGVGSKIDKTSLIVYKKGTKYKQWEFIFNPLEQQASAAGGGGAVGVPGSVPAGQANPAPFGGQGSGSSPFGGQPVPPELPQHPSPQPAPQQ